MSPISDLPDFNVACPSSEVLPGRHLKGKSMHCVNNDAAAHDSKLDTQPEQKYLQSQNDSLLSPVLRVIERFVVFFLLSACFIAELLTPDGRLVWSHRGSILRSWLAHVVYILTQLLTMKWQGKKPPVSSCAATTVINCVWLPLTFFQLHSCYNGWSAFLQEELRYAYLLLP